MAAKKISQEQADRLKGERETIEKLANESRDLCLVCRRKPVPEGSNDSVCSTECRKERSGKDRRQTAAGISRGDRRKIIERGFSSVGLAVTGLMGDEVCGGAILKQSEALSEALEDLAEQHPQIDRTLALTSSANGWLTLAGAAFPIVATVYTHHMAARTEDEDSNGPEDMAVPVSNGDVPKGFDMTGITRNPIDAEDTAGA